jgi:hypothetical protein
MNTLLQCSCADTPAGDLPGMPQTGMGWVIDSAIYSLGVGVIVALIVVAFIVVVALCARQAIR